MDLIRTLAVEAWHRATSTQPVPDLRFVVLTGLVAAGLVLWPATWPRVRLGVTVVHEAGHAVVAVLVGRRLSGIHLNADTSGVTVSRGRPRGPGVVAMLLAGYLAPGLLGLLAAVLLAAGRSVGLLWLLLVLVVALVVWVRNLYGAAVLLLAGAVVLTLTWWAGALVQSVAAYLVAWTLLLAAPRPLLELLGEVTRSRGRRRRRTSDPDQLAGLTHVPAAIWTLLLLLANLAGLVVGVSTLAPALT